MITDPMIATILGESRVTPRKLDNGNIVLEIAIPTSLLENGNCVKPADARMFVINCNVGTFMVKAFVKGQKLAITRCDDRGKVLVLDIPNASKCWCYVTEVEFEVIE